MSWMAATAGIAATCRPPLRFWRKRRGFEPRLSIVINGAANDIYALGLAVWSLMFQIRRSRSPPPIT
ncbi:hypothetical protein BLAT2472_40587 [Burkholderia latens]